MLKILALDVDGTINESSLAKIASNPHISRLLVQIPTLKKAALEIIEAGEVFFKVRHKMNVGMEKVCCDRGVPHVGIITDRSARGLATALGEKDYILQGMSFIQVRRPISDKNVGKLRYGPKLWEVDEVKPHESVLYQLAAFAKKKGIKSCEVLIWDDDPKFRFIAKSRFGFTVYPDDTEDIESREKSCFQTARNSPDVTSGLFYPR